MCVAKQKGRKNYNLASLYLFYVNIQYFRSLFEDLEILILTLI